MTRDMGGGEQGGAAVVGSAPLVETGYKPWILARIDKAAAQHDADVAAGWAQVVPPAHMAHTEKELGELGRWRAACRCGWVSDEYSKRFAADRAAHQSREDRPMTDATDIPQLIRDHRLQPRIRHNDGPPAEDYECLCGEMFWGVAEWSDHVAQWVIGACGDAFVRAARAGSTGWEQHNDHRSRGFNLDRWCPVCKSEPTPVLSGAPPGGPGQRITDMSVAPQPATNPPKPPTVGLARITPPLSWLKATCERLGLTADEGWSERDYIRAIHDYNRRACKCHHPRADHDAMGCADNEDCPCAVPVFSLPDPEIDEAEPDSSCLPKRLFDQYLNALDETEAQRHMGPHSRPARSDDRG